MDPCIHRWVSNERGGQRRDRNTGPLPRRTESLSERGRGKVLLKLPCRNRSPHTGCLHSPDHDCKQVVFLSDALFVLQAYQNHKLPNLTKALQQVATTRRAVLQWIPAHCGILDNEQADILAKEGARGEQHVNNVSFSEKKTLIRALTKPKLQRDDYHLLSRKQQVILVRLRTGHTSD